MEALVGYTPAWEPREVLRNAKESETVWKGRETPHVIPWAHHATMREGHTLESEIHS
jgi:hypothetical protein